MSMRKSDLIRTSLEFKEFINELRRTKSMQEQEEISSARITQAVFNQYMKYPDLINEIKKAKLGKRNK